MTSSESRRDGSRDVPHGAARRAALVSSLAVLLALGACTEGADGIGGPGGPGGTSGTGGPDTGRGGSTARMAIDGDYLYAIGGDTVQLFDITTPAAPQPWTRVTFGDDVRSLLPFGGHLIVGGLDGVYVLDNADPAAPRRLAELPHVTATSPVAARGALAYVALRADFTRPPPASEDRLEVLDLADPSAPILLETVPMDAPAGLAVHGDRLHVCDREVGLVTFDLAEPAAPRLVDRVPQERCDDLIASAEGLLHVVAEDGLRQYDLTTGRPLLLSEIGREPIVLVADR